MTMKELKRHASRLAQSTLSPVPLPFWQNVFPKDLISLCYHMVSDESLPHFQLFSYKTTGQFRADVAFAKSRAISYRDLLNARLSGAPVPANSILFTFDDGFAECFHVVRPILLEHRVDAVFFVTTDFIDDRTLFRESKVSLCMSAALALPIARVLEVVERWNIEVPADGQGASSNDQPARASLLSWLAESPHLEEIDLDDLCAHLGVEPAAYLRDHQIFMNRDQIRQLVADGFTVGAHGLNHRLLEYLDPDEIEAEMVASCEIIREITKCERVPFAFPHSGINVDRNVIADIMRRHPFIELVFDSGNLRRDKSFIVNRVFTDTPPKGMTTNVPAALQDAWSIPSAWYRGT